MASDPRDRRTAWLVGVCGARRHARAPLRREWNRHLPESTLRIESAAQDTQHRTAQRRTQEAAGRRERRTRRSGSRRASRSRSPASACCTARSACKGVRQQRLSLRRPTLLLPDALVRRGEVLSRQLPRGPDGRRPRRHPLRTAVVQALARARRQAARSSSRRISRSFAAVSGASSASMAARSVSLIRVW